MELWETGKNWETLAGDDPLFAVLTYKDKRGGNANRYPNRCTYLVNAGNDLARFPNNHFDLIYSKITLQHMHPRYAARYLREFMRTLSPKGVLIFQPPTEPERRVAQSIGFRAARTAPCGAERRGQGA